MILKALEMQGFKSFPDKTVLTFDRGMTAVVGPNGSGKSNISDAVRWVLGEQSTKNLRGSKMEDVIFSGTAERRAMGYAEVTLRLDNTDRTLDRADDEVAVTRRFYRSGESEYKINGTAVRLRDVNELFMDTGLGRDGYSIVGQGKIADMVSSRSPQRRDMLEEAAGISHYRYKRADALHRLDQAEENLVRLRDILAELESRVGPLKTQSEKAQRFLALSDRRKTLEVGLWLYRIDDLKNKLKEQEHKIDLATAQYTDAENSLQDIEQRMEDTLASSRDITVKIDELRRSVSEHEARTSEYSSGIAVGNNTIENRRQSIERVRSELENAEKSRSERDAALEKMLADIRNMEEQADQKREALASVKAHTEELDRSTGSVQEQTGRLEEQRTANAEQQADARVRGSAALASVEELKSRVEKTEGTTAERQKVLEEAEGLDNDAAARAEAAEEAVQSAANALKGYELRMNSRGQKAEKADAASAAVRRQYEDTESRARMLEDLEKNMEGYTGSVKAVAREQKRGTLTGICGTLSQLIIVEERYSAAIETALGAAVQFIVVNREEDAKAAIRFLKNAHAGRATFLPLTAIRGRELNESGLESCSGFIAVAADLVKADAQYSNIIRAQLGRTVVVDDMDNAVRMGRQYHNRFRIVTLDGQVINAGGSMTGGSRGRNAGILARSGEVEKLKKQSAELAEQARAAETAADSARADAAKAQAEYEAAAADLQSANDEQVRAESARELAASRLASARSALSDLERERREAAARMSELQTEAADASAEEARLSKEAEAFEQQLSETNENMDRLRAEAESAAKERSDADLKLLGLTKDIEAAQAQADGLRESGRTDEARDEERRREMTRYEEDIKVQQENVKTLQDKIDDLAAFSKKSGEEIEALTEKRNEAESESSRMRILERNKTDEREKMSGELARLEERKAGMLRNYDETVNKLYEEYQLTRREAAAVSAPTENPSETQKQLNEVKAEIRGLGSVNVGAIDEYKVVSERYEFLSGQIDDVEISRGELKDLIDQLTDDMAKRFREQLSRINTAFGSTFTDLFGGGKAELSLQDEGDVLESPIDIRVQPPGKNVQNIDLLSGGEKGLSAIALLFAILKVTPSPFCIFDEVEAALDDVNVRRFAQYVRSMTNDTQFILITHRRGTMEEADILYGVTMEEEGVSKLLELKTAEMVKQLGLQ